MTSDIDDDEMTRRGTSSSPRPQRWPSRRLRSYRTAFSHLSSNARRYLLTVALQNVGYGVMGTVFAIHVKTSGFSEAFVGDAEAALALSAAVVCLTLPVLVGSVGYRKLLIAAGFLLGAARLGQAFVPSAYALIGLGLVFGLGDGTMQTLSSAFLSENTGRSSHTALFTADFVVRIGAMVAGAILGGGIPMLLGHALGEAGAVQVTMVAAALLMMMSGLAATRIEETSTLGGRSLAALSLALRGFRSWGRLTRLLVPQVFVSFGAGLVMPFVALYLRHELGASLVAVGLIQAVSSAAIAVGALATPTIARRVGLTGAVVLTELASLPFLLLIPFQDSLPVVAVLFWLRGMLMNMSQPVYSQLSMLGLPPVDKPFVAGWIHLGWSVAWFAGSALGGRLMESSYRTPYFYTAALYALGAVATYLLLRSIESSGGAVGVAPLTMPESRS